MTQIGQRAASASRARPGQLALGGALRRPRAAAVAGPVASALPVAQVAVDTGLAHLDRTFDYAVPQAFSDGVQAGCRVRVRFAGRLVDGVVLRRVAASAHGGELTALAALVSPEPVLSDEVARLARAVADRWAGTLYDVLRLALPPRHARVECEPVPTPEEGAGPCTSPTPSGGWVRYPAGPAMLDALRNGGSPRAVWCALPGPHWPDEVAAAVHACTASGRGAVVVVPDGRDLDRVCAALRSRDVAHAALRADLGPAERYRRWLSVRRGGVRVAVGTRAAAFAPVRDLGLVVVWDDGDELHAEPRAPYPQVRDLLVLRAHLTGAAALIGGHARTCEGQLLVDTGWARDLSADRPQVRGAAPVVEGVGDDDLARDPLARAARLPAKAFAAARASLAAGAPVLVQVPRRGGAPSLACARDRSVARCPVCAGPLGAERLGSGQGGDGAEIPACRWCGRLAGDWQCPHCNGRALRASVVGARRTAEELGRAFPGVTVRTSGRDEVLAAVRPGPALVISTPGAEPVAEGGYGAVLLLDGWAALGRSDLRAGEEALRRWLVAAALARPAADGGRVVAVADPGLPAVQALIRWDPVGAARRELAQRAELRFPPVTRMAALDGTAPALAELRQELALPAGGDLLGPVPYGETERLLARVPRSSGLELATALKGVAAVRSAGKAEPVRIELDPQSLT